MRILILGAGGFIGSHMVEHLVRRGEHSVVAVDVSDDKLTGIDRRGFTFRFADIRTDGALIDTLVAETDLVVDLIAYANPSMYVTSPLEVFELNFMQNLEIAKRCSRHGRRLIQYSSAEIYGKAAPGAEACGETDTDSVFGPVHRQRWIYATGKLLLERVLYAMGNEGELEYTIVRPFNFLGPRIDYLVDAHSTGGPRVFPHFMSALLTGGPIRLVNGGLVRRSFLNIADANDAFQVLLDHPDATRNEIFNMGNPLNNITIREFAGLMLEIYEELTGSAAVSAIEEMSGEEFYGPGYEDGDRLPPAVGKLASLGWVPRYDLRTTLVHTMRYYLDAYGADAQAATVRPVEVTRGITRAASWLSGAAH